MERANPIVMLSLALALAGVFALLGGLHVWWAFKGSSTTTAIPTEHGRPLFQPTTAQTLAVAFALFAASYVVLGRAGLVGAWLPPWFFRCGTLTLALVFAARAIGDFRHVGLFKTNRATSFAHWDTRLFTPLCILISLASLRLTL